MYFDPTLKGKDGKEGDKRVDDDDERDKIGGDKVGGVDNKKVDLEGDR